MKDYTKYYRPEELEPFYPNELLRHLLVVFVLIAVLLLGVIFLPESAQEALPLSEGAAEKKPVWYLLPIHELSKLVPERAVFLGILGCAAAVLLSVPLWDRTGEKRLWKRPIFFPRVIICLIIILSLGIIGRLS
ncbi:MAG: hypothetical protein V3V45_02770 [Candidatus Brocadiales bacterium]